ncbi:MAG: hypothetical protein AzoDbin1_02037 [Azoarcus sp.]|uniref:3-oxoacyl-[acyl-carrier-protein] synthase-1 n=1 Tax=Aromatoleum tolulyticum TaxID=34027 RepID=A0A1N6VCW5_9RHOO|nr:hypothetical protein [Aromatoleum tolulyticum]MCK9985565.1 hypothetical protein [Azoarcus sp.]SIQ75665.1 hypothetical protein SAMN05421829_106241 [Aromatoleum tolulyticum]
MFAFALRPLVLAVLVTTLVWALVLGWWQAAGFEPSTIDVATHLVFLPATLLAGFWLLRAFIEHLRLSPPSAANAHPPPAPETSGLQTSAASSPTRRPDALLIAFALQCAHGTDPAQVLDAGRHGCAPPLDDHLRDAHGFPVFAARVADLSPEALDEALYDRAVDLSQPNREEERRALAMLHMTLPRALDEIAESITLHPAAIRSVFWLSDRDWPDEQRARHAAWLQRKHLAPRGIAPADVQFRHVQDDAHAFEIIDDVTAALNRQESPAVALVMGAVSHVGEGTVANWEAGSHLFTAHTQDGRIPGEAAAVLLLANPAGAALVRRVPSPRLSRAASGRSARAGDAEATTDGSLLGSLIDGILADMHLDAAHIANVLADADHRAPVTKELLRTLSERFPALEPLSDTISLGPATGFASPIGGLVALLCAAEAANAADGLALCLTCQSPNARAAMIVDASPLNSSSPPQTPASAPAAT